MVLFVTRWYAIVPHVPDAELYKRCRSACVCILNTCLVLEQRGMQKEEYDIGASEKKGIMIIPTRLQSKTAAHLEYK